MATTVCSKTISLKVWNAATDAWPISIPISLANGPTGIGTYQPGKYVLTASTPPTDAWTWIVDDDIGPPPPGEYIAVQGGGYGDCTDMPATYLNPIGDIPGWTARSYVQPTAIAAAKAGLLSLNPLLTFDLLVATVLEQGYPSTPTVACGITIAGNVGGPGDVHYTLSRIGKL